MAADERLYFVVYDISNPKRWRGVFKTMHGYGEWVQLSVFQCRLSPMRHAELIADLDLLIHHDEDHVVIVDVGQADNVDPKIVSLGKKPFRPVEREPLVI
ncbi:MAG: CRISPR-associated endonuclease Cas2 [Pseudomonadota bacterium]